MAATAEPRGLRTPTGSPRYPAPIMPPATDPATRMSAPTITGWPNVTNSIIVGETLTKTLRTRSTPKASTNTTKAAKTAPAASPARAPVRTASDLDGWRRSPPSTRGPARR